MTIFAVVASGQNVSGDIDLRKQKLVGLHVPTLGSSGTLALQGNFDQTSGGFVRFLDTRQPGSGDLQFAVGAGSRFVLTPPMLETPPFMRLEVITAAGSFQTDNRTFSLLTRPR